MKLFCALFMVLAISGCKKADQARPECIHKTLKHPKADVCVLSSTCRPGDLLAITEIVESSRLGAQCTAPDEAESAYLSHRIWFVKNPQTGTCFSGFETPTGEGVYRIACDSVSNALINK